MKERKKMSTFSLLRYLIKKKVKSKKRQILHDCSEDTCSRVECCYSREKAMVT